MGATLIVRGARQTGKTTAIRLLAEAASLYLELNLERHDDLALVRTGHSAAELLEQAMILFRATPTAPRT